MKIGIYAAVAVAAIAAGYGIYHYGVEPRLALDPAAPGAAGPAQAAALSSVPEMLPDFTLTDLDGTPRSIRSWAGKSMIVNFWATWCAPCRREMPLLNALHQERAAAGFQVVGVAVDFRDEVIRFARQIGIQYPILVGEQDGLDAMDTFGQGGLGFPFTVFTDNRHRIVLLHLGEIGPAEADVLLSAVERVNSGELTPLAARGVAAEQLAALPGADFAD
jgi:thiol-disulfide isomerase/thioredoxin